MRIHFKHVPDNADGEASRNKGPLVIGTSDEDWNAVCSIHTLTIYEQAFQNDPASAHKSLVDDITDFHESEQGDPLGKVIMANWEADIRALWAMLKCACEAGLNGDRDVPQFQQWSREHAADDVDIYLLHLLTAQEVDATFPALTAATAELTQKQRKRKK